MDRMSAMEAFVAVAEAGSFTRAASQMRISTPMVTLHIRRLEEHLAVRLFNRSTRRVDLTAEGTQFLSYARATLDAFRAAERSIRPGGGLTGRVRIDAPASMGHDFIVPALPAFHRAHPDIAIDLSLGDRGTFFRMDGFDLILRAGNAPGVDWTTQMLGTTRLVCVASPDYLTRHGEPLDAEALMQHQCILYASVEAPGGNPWTFMSGDRPLKVRPPTTFTFNDGASILSAARAGLGIAQTLDMLARNDIRAGRLVPLLPELCVFSLPVMLMAAPDRIALPHVRAAFDFLSDAIDWGLEA